MTHYFKNDPNLGHKDIKINLDYQNQSFTFYSDIGVFSKDEIDDGSKLLLDVVSEMKIEGSLLDVGCGYGLLGIVLKRLSPGVDITMIDVNQRAIDLAKRNAEYNKTEVEIKISDIYENVGQQYNLVITNPPIRAGKVVVHSIIEKAPLIAGGQLVVVIRKSHGAESAKKLMENIYGNVQVVKKNKGFYILKSIKG